MSSVTGAHLIGSMPPLGMPKHAAIMVEMTRDVRAHLGRRMDFLRLPVPKDRMDDAYFPPLGDLSLPAESALYLGLMHHPMRPAIARASLLRTR